MGKRPRSYRDALAERWWAAVSDLNVEEARACLAEDPTLLRSKAPTSKRPVIFHVLECGTHKPARCAPMLTFLIGQGVNPMDTNYPQTFEPFLAQVLQQPNTALVTTVLNAATFSKQAQQGTKGMRQVLGAMVEHHPEFLPLMQEKGIDLAQGVEEGVSLMSHAIRTSSQAVAILFEMGRTRTVQEQAEQGWFQELFHHKILQNQKEKDLASFQARRQAALQTLIEHGFTLNDHERQTLTVQAIRHAPTVALLTHLRSMGAEVTIHALQAAVNHAQGMIPTLLTWGVPLEQAGERSLLAMALYERQPQAVAMLLDAGAATDVATLGGDPFAVSVQQKVKGQAHHQRAFDERSQTIWEVLLDHGLMLTPEVRRWAIPCAVAQGAGVERVERLMKEGAHPQGLWENANAVFHAVKKSASDDLLTLLLDHGVDPHQRPWGSHASAWDLATVAHGDTTAFRTMEAHQLRRMANEVLENAIANGLDGISSIKPRPRL